tara:strand:+ start:292 stop:1407 length:1116 start_codon:yes stop_codon:yes gene_type:complete
MQTVLQNTDIEESLTKLASEDAFNPLDGGNLLDDAETVDEEQAPTEEPAEEEPQEEEAVAEVEEEESSEEEETEEEEEEAEEVEEVEEEKDDFSGQLKKATKNIPTARDYSKYSEEDAKYLKQMSNEAFEHFSKKSSENIDLQKKLEDTSTQQTADHPDAYVLSDEYKDSYANLTKAQQEQQHWRSQLIKIRNGETWSSIQGYDEKGSMVLSKDPYKPTQQAEVDVEMALQEAVTLNRKFSDKLENVSKTFKGNYKEAVTLLESEQKSNFAWITDEKVANEEIVLPNIGTTSIKAVKSSFEKAIPKTFRNHPLAELASNLFVTLQLQAAQSTAEKVKTKESKRKEPKTRRKGSSKTSVSADDLSIPDWMNI